MSEEELANVLGNSLLEVGLESKYWIHVLKTKVSSKIRSPEDIKSLDSTTVDNIKKCIRFRWEEFSLNELFDKPGIGYEIHRRYSLQDRFKEGGLIVDAMKSLHADENRDRMHPMVKLKEEQMRHVLGISKQYSVTNYENISLGDVIKKYESHVKELGTLAAKLGGSNKVDSNVLQKASDGIVLKGILISKYMQDCTIKGTVLENPPLRSITHRPSETIELEFSSEPLSKLFWKLVCKVGFSMAEKAKCGQCQFKVKSAEKCWECKSHDGNPETEICYSRHMYNVLPTYACKLDASQLRFSRDALSKLREVLSSTDPDIIKSKCVEFLKTFGSHVIVGSVTLGGIFGWQVSEITSGAARKDELKNVLSAFHSATNTGFTMTPDGQMETLQMYGSTSSLYNKDQFSKEIKVIGGPKRTKFYPIWKIGALSSTDAWAVIDRGGGCSNNFVGIWELLRENEGLDKVNELGEYLKVAWEDMYELSGKSKRKVGRRISEWTDTENTVSYMHMIEYLQHLLMEETDFPSGIEKQYELLRFDTTFEEIVPRFIQCSLDNSYLYTSQEVYHVRYLLYKLANEKSRHKFPEKDRIMEWIYVDQMDHGVLNLLKTGPLKSIPDLFDAIEDKFLPAMRKFLPEKNQHTNINILDQIRIQVSSELALLIYQLNLHLDKLGEIKHLDFLQSALHDRLAYNASRHIFEQLIVFEKLEDFVKKTKLLWLNTPEDHMKTHRYFEGELSLSSFEDEVTEEVKPKHKIDSAIAKSTAAAGTTEAKLLKLLGLTEYFPSKLSLQHVMTCGAESPFYQVGKLLQSLMMANYKGRDESITVNTDDDVEKAASGGCMDKEKNKLPASVANIVASFSLRKSKQTTLNPQDVIVAVFACSDLMLKQTLVQKMFICQLAIPFIYPQLTSDSWMCSIWALRSIVMEWRTKDQTTVECSLTEHNSTNIVSFVRLGDQHSLSKSRLMNILLMDHGHNNTFFNEGSPQGNTQREFANGLVEASCFLPSGKESDILPNVTMFLNLRDDATKHPKQLKILMKMSCVVVACTDVTNLSNTSVVTKMKDVHTHCKHVVLLLLVKDFASFNVESLGELLVKYINEAGDASFVLGFDDKGTKNANTLKTEIGIAIAKCLDKEKGSSILKACSFAKEVDIAVDEEDDECQEGQQLAEKVSSFMRETWRKKKEIVPLQGTYWLKWSSISKQHSKSGKTSGPDSLEAKGKLEKEMTSLRQKQLQIVEHMPSMMKSFISTLNHKMKEPAVISFFLRWLKFTFDVKSRASIPKLQQKYLAERRQYDYTKKKGEKLETIRVQVKTAEEVLTSALFGLEHLIREMGQLYEAVRESNVKVETKTEDMIQKLPTIAAQILLLGHPLEIMDGDTSTMPLTWIKAIFNCIIDIVGDKKVFVLSVLGIQSSGKSTLLNTMFGIEFAVSAGRCTRGVFINLVKMKPEQTDAKFDYMLVVDTEGLRAPELDQRNYIHDNELATLVIGLSDVTMINLKGENASEMQDILQIAVHAFLRMKIVNKNFQLEQACLFLHQNVSAVSAKDKMGYGNQKLLSGLDDMTAEAAKSENMSNIHEFNQVIFFDIDTHVWYFSDLWLGDPPMAPANPGYSERVLELKQYILHEMTKKQATFLTFSNLAIRVEDLWKGVIADDFVFSFRNSLAVKAYTMLEGKYNELTWSIESDTMEWLTKDALIKLQGCASKAELQESCRNLVELMEDKIHVSSNKAHADLTEFIETSNLKNILFQWQDAKRTSLDVSVRSIKKQVERDIKDLMESLRFELVQKEKQADYERLITRKARELADELRGKVKTSDSQLSVKFDAVWQEWVDDIGARIPPEDVSISEIVKKMLWDRLEKDHRLLEKELKLHKLSQPLEITSLSNSLKLSDISTEYISVPVNKQRAKTDEEYCQQALKKAESLLQKVDDYLLELSCQNSKFVISYATNVLRVIVDGVHQHNETNSENFTLLPSFTIMLVVHACRHAVCVFNEMQNQYEETHGLKAKLEACKNTFWNYFKNLVDQSTTEVIVADLICDRIEEHIQLDVFKRMPREIVDDISRQYGSKYHLVLAMLDDLAVNGNFGMFVDYLENAKSYSLHWLTKTTDQEFFHADELGHSKYATYAEKHIKNIVQCLENSSKWATEHVNQESDADPEMSTWIKLFSTHMSKEIALQETEMEQALEHKVTDFSNLHRLISKRLPRLEKNALDPFKVTTAEDIAWEGITPYKQLVSRLWGCAEQCPFCKEPCQWTDSNHLGSFSHRCIQHRPQGVGGLQWVDTGRLCIENCCYLVQAKHKKFSCGACANQCQNSGNCSGEEGSFHDYVKYKTFIPDWDIAPSASMDHSDFWKWFMVTYKESLAKRHLCNVPAIPQAWYDITMKEACDSLREYQF